MFFWRLYPSPPFIGSITKRKVCLSSLSLLIEQFLNFGLVFSGTDCKLCGDKCRLAGHRETRYFLYDFFTFWLTFWLRLFDFLTFWLFDFLTFWLFYFSTFLRTFQLFYLLLFYVLFNFSTYYFSMYFSTILLSLVGF